MSISVRWLPLRPSIRQRSLITPAENWALPAPITAILTAVMDPLLYVKLLVDQAI